MGNYKFRLSDMIPNFWFYNLKAMRHKKSNKNENNIRRSQQPPRTPKPLPFTSQPKLLPNRASDYFSSRTEADGYSNHALHSKVASDAEILLPLDPPRRSTKTSRRKPKKASPSDAKLVTSSVSAGCGCRAWKEAESITEFLQPASACYVDDELPHSQETNVAGGLQRDSDVNVRTKSSHPDTVPERELPPIKTKPAKKEGDAIELEHKISDDKTSSYRGCGPAVRQNKSHTRRSPPGLHRLRMRACSPQLASRKLHAFHGERTKGSLTSTLAAMQQQRQQQKRVSGSFAVVKSSSDPQKDFRDSMVEMITENNMRTSKDLEELLVCYLLLNSKEYHDLIMEVFEQLWIDLITKR